MKIAINGCYGGFNLSHEAFIKLIENGWKVTGYTEEGNYADQTAQIVDSSSDGMPRMTGWSNYSLIDRSKDIRTNSDLIDVIEKLGVAANGPCSNLKIVDVPDDVEWVIDEYDGNEWVAEVHQTWN